MYYFDYTATSPMTPDAVNEYCDTAIRYPGNPSSVHSLGIEAKTKLEYSREFVASILNVKPENIFFTSGGTESDSIILDSLLNSPVGGQVVALAIEHSAILEHKRILNSHGWNFTTVKCPDGYVNPDSLLNVLTPQTRLVCIMAVNNVTGTIQNLSSCISIIRNYEKTINRKIHIHCDAVQALGKIKFYPSILGLDSAAFSAHKFGGPRGIGVLFCCNNSILSLSRGGGQEKGLRPGTENLPAICSMVKALEIANSELDAAYEKVLGFRFQVEKSATNASCTLLSPSCSSNLAFSPYILNIALPKNIPSEVFLRIMSDKGFCLSAGSACSSNSRGKAESVLASMNVSPQKRMSSIRISFSSHTLKEEVDALCFTLNDVCKNL